MGIVARQATWNTLLTIVGMGLGFVNMALLFPRLLTPDEFGLTRLIVSIAVVAAQIAHFGGENTVIRYFPYFRDKANGHRGLFGLALGVSTLGAFIAMLVLGLFHEQFVRWFSDSSGLYQRFGLLVLPLVLAEVYLLILRGFSRSVNRSIAPVFAREFLLRVLQTLLIAAYALWDMSFTLFLLLYVGTFVLTTAMLLFDLWRAGEFRLGLAHMRVGKRMRKSMVRYSLFTFASGIAGIAVGNIDQVMVGAMLHDGLSYVAFYAVAMFLASVITIPARALLQPTIPLLAEAWKKRDNAQIRMLYHRTASIQLVVSAFILLGLCTNADAIFSFLQPEYGIGKPVMFILGIAHVISLSTGLSAGIISTSRSYSFDAMSGAVYLVLNIVLDYLFLLWWGIIGAAWSTFVSVLIIVGWRVIFLQRKFNLWPFDGMTLRALTMIGAVTGVFWFLPHYGSPMMDMVWRSLLLTAVYWSVVHVLGIAPELGTQARKLLRGFGASLKRG
ncbi:MAG: oligosaccharide flippase family protein [Flavobacteriales bacterium]|jgi:O-antigen/teichoic acid export membrane protein|nr:oligosaccharide flippase family protein [Flavobacteriales bacterium]MCB0757281.1 oligosaccharide flippase family protein [Flavobacteriales bacterium]